MELEDPLFTALAAGVLALLVLRSVVLSTVAHRHDSWASTVGWLIFTPAVLLTDSMMLVGVGASAALAGELYYQTRG